MSFPSENNNILFAQKKNTYTDDKKIRVFMHSAMRCVFSFRNCPLSSATSASTSEGLQNQKNSLSHSLGHPTFFSNGSSSVSSGRVTSVSLLLRHHKSLNTIASKATAASSPSSSSPPPTSTQTPIGSSRFPPHRSVLLDTRFSILRIYVSGCLINFRLLF